MSESSERRREASRLARRTHPVNACKIAPCKGSIEWVSTADDYEEYRPAPYAGYCSACRERADLAAYPLAQFPVLFEVLAGDFHATQGVEFGEEAGAEDDRHFDGENRARAKQFAPLKARLTAYARGASA